MEEKKSERKRGRRERRVVEVEDKRKNKSGEMKEECDTWQVEDEL